MKIYLTDKNKVYTYVISEVKVVQPTEVAVVDDTPGKSEVTLVTCTDAEATQRTIVKGELKSQVDFDKASSDIIEAFNKSYINFKVKKGAFWPFFYGGKYVFKYSAPCCYYCF